MIGMQIHVNSKNTQNVCLKRCILFSIAHVSPVISLAMCPNFVLAQSQPPSSIISSWLHPSGPGFQQLLDPVSLGKVLFWVLVCALVLFSESLFNICQSCSEHFLFWWIPQRDSRQLLRNFWVRPKEAWCSRCCAPLHVQQEWRRISWLFLDLSKSYDKRKLAFKRLSGFIYCLPLNILEQIYKVNRLYSCKAQHFFRPVEGKVRVW